ncbi:hypothetical protein ACFX13_010924 [Malus domestica]
MINSIDEERGSIWAGAILATCVENEDIEEASSLVQNQEAAAQNCSRVEQNAKRAYAGQEFIETEAVAHACLLLLQCIILRSKKRFQNTYAGVRDLPSLACSVVLGWMA